MGFAREVGLALSSEPLVACRDYFGYIPAVYRAQGLLPRLLEAEIGLEAALVYRESALSHLQKERLLLALASAEGNSDGATTHYEMLRLFGEPEARLDEILVDYRHCGLPLGDVELLGFAVKLCTGGSSVCAVDIDHLKTYGWGDAVILEAVLVSGWYRFCDCLAAGVGTSRYFQPGPIIHVGVGTQDPSTVEPSCGVRPYLQAPELAADRFPAFPIFRDLFGFIPNVFRSQAACLSMVEAEAELLNAVLAAEDHLSRRQ